MATVKVKRVTPAQDCVIYIPKSEIYERFKAGVSRDLALSDWNSIPSETREGMFSSSETVEITAISNEDFE